MSPLRQSRDHCISIAAIGQQPLVHPGELGGLPCLTLSCLQGINSSNSLGKYNSQQQLPCAQNPNSAP